MLIGLTGFAGSGKSEAADVLIGEFSFRRVKFATGLKNMTRALLRTIGYCDDDVERFIEGDLKQSVIPEVGRTSRFVMIDLGTRWRLGVNKLLWVNLAAAQVDNGGDVVIDDLRFTYEADMIRAKGGIVIRLERPGTKPAAYRFGRIGRVLYGLGLKFGAHPSERPDLIPADIVLRNVGSVEELRQKVRDHAAVARLNAQVEAARCA